MKKSILYSAIAASLCMPATQVYAAHGSSVSINNMEFGGTNYLSKGTLTDDTDNFGLMQSVEVFFNEPWAAAATAYFEPGQPPVFDNDLATDQGNITNGTIPDIFDNPAVNGPFTQSATDDGPDGAGGTMYTWTGSADQSPGGSPPEGGPFTYNFTLQPNEIAWGTLFNWNTNAGIPVLVIVDCVTNPAVCQGRGTPMVTAPFPGSAPAFSGGPPPLACENPFSNISPGESLVIQYAELTSGCSGGLGDVNFVSADAASSQGGSVTDNGTALTYVPAVGFTGSDTFNYELKDDLTTVNPVYDITVGDELQGNFTMFQPGGIIFGGANDVVFEWDQVSFNNDESDPVSAANGLIKISSETTFFGPLWTAHHIRVYDGGPTGRTLTFDTSCTVAQLEAGTADCGGPPERKLALPIPPNMYGAHILFDWNGNFNIDVVNVWQPNGKWEGDFGVYLGAKGVPPDVELSTWELVSKDVNGDGVNGAPMLEGDGPFPGNYANFSWKPDASLSTGAPTIDTKISPVKVPSVFSLNIWGMLFGLSALLGLRRYKK